MGRHIRVGKFEANLPGIHTLPVTDAFRIANSEPGQQPFVVSQVIMKHLTYLQRKRFESLTIKEFTKVVEQWIGAEEKK
jgi:hypothetical protein